MKYRPCLKYFLSTLMSVLATCSQAQVNVGDGDVLTQEDLIAGEFNGQIFQLNESTSFRIRNGGLLTGLPAVDFAPFDMGGSTVVIELGGLFETVRDGQESAISNIQLDVLPGSAIEGDIGCELSNGSQVNLLGGTINTALRLYGSDAQVESGSVASLLINNNSTLEMNGGEITGIARFEGLNPTGVINGGRIYGGVTALNNSLVYLNAGAFGSGSKLDQAAILNWSGGAIGHEFEVLGQSTLRITGGEFKLNNELITQLNHDLQDGEVLTGVLPDGLPFVLTPMHGDAIPVAGLELIHSAVPPVDSSSIVLENQRGPLGYRGVERVEVLDGGVIPGNAAAMDTTIIVDGGEIEPGFECVRSEIDLLSGNIGWEVALLDHSTLVMHDGAISSWLTVTDGSRFDIHNGSALWNLNASQGGVINQYGGQLGSHINIDFGAVINIHGGERGLGLFVRDGGQFHIFAQTAMLNGVPIDLEVGEQMVISERGGAVLEGVLEDGTPFREELHDGFSLVNIFWPGSTVLVTLVNSCLPDLTADGTLNFFDVSAFLTGYQAQDPIADFNNDAEFNFFDVSAFLTAYSAGCP